LFAILDDSYALNVSEPKLDRFRPDRKNRARSSLRYRFSHTAQKHMLETASPVRPHGDQIGMDRFGVLDNRVGCLTFFCTLLPRDLF
jgi:hypothetical protein